MSELAGVFWADIEAHHPGIDTLRLPQDVVDGRPRSVVTVFQATSSHILLVDLLRRQSGNLMLDFLPRLEAHFDTQRIQVFPRLIAPPGWLGDVSFSANDTWCINLMHPLH
ncbi:hypothetical protein [Streptomyces pseudogriseolus]|uniref:hypothetical protein n=2 Tax=Streptomyces pseudogriseolus TaxID=36817 RepID=UPI001CE252E2|nr:hypothetical protein [Streptomyces pseudogriseolus]